MPHNNNKNDFVELNNMIQNKWKNVHQSNNVTDK